MKPPREIESGCRAASRQRRTIVTLFAAVALAGGALWATGVRAQGSAESRERTVPAVPPPPVTSGEADLPSVIVVPHGHRQDERIGNGCWVRFYDGKSYEGRSLTLVGPVQMPKMNIPGGLWVNWSSVVVGPRATVTTYDFEHYKNATAVLRPGQRIPDLRDRKLGLFEDIHSLRMACKG